MVTHINQRLISNLSDSPLCTNDFNDGSYHRIKDEAITYKYISLNKKNYSLTYLVFDLDYAGSGIVTSDLDLPTPTFIIVNPVNAHSHIIYEIETPVHLGEFSSIKARKYLEVIRLAYTRKLKADFGFTGTLCKNPLHNYWFTKSYDVKYSLDELAEPLRITNNRLRNCSLEEMDTIIKSLPIENSEKIKLNKKGIREEFIIEGRNCFLFEHGRFYAYQHIVDIFLNTNNFSVFYDKVLYHLLELNNTDVIEFFPEKGRLNEREVYHVNEHICKWVWQNRYDFVSSRQKFIEKQKRKQKLSANRRKENNLKRIKDAVIYLKKNNKKITLTSISIISGLHRNTLSKYKEYIK